jgi:hypothetical protein
MPTFHKGVKGVGIVPISKIWTYGKSAQDRQERLKPL